jgi:hypothetical protein
VESRFLDQEEFIDRKVGREETVLEFLQTMGGVLGKILG